MKKWMNAMVLGLSLAVGVAKANAPVVIQDFSSVDPKTSKDIGTYQDDKGSKIALEKAGKGDKTTLALKYTLVQGGWCGLWCRAGGVDWAGVDLTASKTVEFSVNSKGPVVLGMSLTDKNKNQYVAEVSVKGGAWEKVSVPLDSFKLDPYYTPPEAIKGAAKDFSKVSTFGLTPKTVGTAIVNVKDIVAQ
ncbi:MAG TPA: carbohydrate binding domain-containing protein [bacterium]|nr:carbohydrate binding domain-containing protein [bacterium]